MSEAIAIELYSRIKVLLPRVHHIIQEEALIARQIARPARPLAPRRIARAPNRAASMGAGATGKGEEEGRSLNNLYCACIAVHVGD